MQSLYIKFIWNLLWSCINFSLKIPQEIVLQKNQGAGPNHQNLGHQKLGQLRERSGREEAQDHGNKSHYAISAC